MITKNLKYFDNTRVSSYRKCPRKFLFRHVFHWTPTGVSIPLAYGSSWHTAMDIIWNGGTTEEALDAWEEEMNNKGFPISGGEFIQDLNFDSKYTKESTRTRLRNYVDRYHNILKTSTLIDTERPFAVPLTTEGVYYVGRMDKVIEDDRGHIKVVEHKTTSAYKKDGPFPPYYLESFSPNSQIDGYLYAGALLFGDRFRGVIADIALVHKTVYDGFYMLPLEKKFELVDAWLYETRMWVDYIRRDIAELLEHYEEYESQPFITLFPRRTEECSSFGGCGYRELCKYIPNPLRLREVSTGFKEEEWKPFEELNLERIELKEED